jgi:hypothetical protein
MLITTVCLIILFLGAFCNEKKEARIIALVREKSARVVQLLQGGSGRDQETHLEAPGGKPGPGCNRLHTLYFRQLHCGVYGG